MGIPYTDETLADIEEFRDSLAVMGRIREDPDDLLCTPRKKPKQAEIGTPGAAGTPSEGGTPCNDQAFRSLVKQGISPASIEECIAKRRAVENEIAQQRRERKEKLEAAREKMLEGGFLDPADEEFRKKAETRRGRPGNGPKRGIVEELSPTGGNQAKRR